MRQTSTYEIKKEQLRNGYFQFGSGDTKILIMGSCRVCNLVSYFIHYNECNGNPFTIYSMDIFNFNWDIDDNRIDFEQKLSTLESDERILEMLKSVDWFIHEFYVHGGMFNTTKGDGNNIYKHGMSPLKDICIPSWNDNFVLVNDIVSFDTDIRKKVIQDYNVLSKLSHELKEEIVQKSWQGNERFRRICLLSDLPEMLDFYFDNWKHKRLTWSYNHTSKWFTLELLRLINEKYLHLDFSCVPESHEDIFSNNYTKLTDLDKEILGIEWDEPVISLKEKLF